MVVALPAGQAGTLLSTAVSFLFLFVVVLGSEGKGVQIAEVEYRDSATVRKMDRADSKWVTWISNRHPLSIRNGVMRDPPPLRFGRKGKHADGQKRKSVAISARRRLLFSMSCVIF